MTKKDIEEIREFLYGIVNFTDLDHDTILAISRQLDNEINEYIDSQRNTNREKPPYKDNKD